MVYQPRPDGAWVDGVSKIFAADTTRWETNQQDASDRLTALPFRPDNVTVSGAQVGRVLAASAVSGGSPTAHGYFDAVAAPAVAAAGNGTTDDRAALAAADTAAQVYGGVVILRPGTYRVASTLTVTSPVIALAGAVVKPDSGVTVTLAGGLDAPRQRIADHSAGGLVVPKRVDHYHPAWWGPVGTSDDTATWTAMAAALAASAVVDSTTAVSFGQRVLAPAGVNRFFGITLANAHLVADKGVSIFYPSGTPTTGSMLTIGDYCTVTGGYWRTNGTGQAVKLIDYQGYRALLEKVYVVPAATGSIGINVGSGSGSITPVLRDIQVHCGSTSSPVGTGIYLNTPDAQLANVWIGPCDIGLNCNRGAFAATNLHVWGCNTGISGSPDTAKISGLYLDSNRGWGLSWDASDRCVITNGHVWNNGGTTTGTGGVRLLKSGSPSSRDNIITGVQFDDNTGVGLLIDGPTGTEVAACRFGSAQVQAGNSAVCDTGVRITSTSTNTRLMIRGRRSDHVTALVDDQSTSTMTDFGTARRTLAADQAFTSTTTLATLLSIPVGAGETWQVEGVLFVDGGQTGDLKVRVQATSATSASGYFGVGGAPAASNTSGTAASFNPSDAAAVASSGGSSVTAGLVGTGTTQALSLVGIVTVGATAGTLELQAAQNASDATATTVRAGSWLRAVRVA